MSNDLSKLFQNCLVSQIISQLSIKEYSIPEIQKILKIQDKKLLIALISELNRFGIINLVNKSNDEEKIENKSILKLSPLISSPDQLLNPLSISLGLPIDKFVSLWNTLESNNEEGILKDLDKIYLTIPNPLKENLKGKGLKEIQQYITNNYI